MRRIQQDKQFKQHKKIIFSIRYRNSLEINNMENEKLKKKKKKI
jgi:hypothetical protein